jgi:hypothetical protein
MEESLPTQQSPAPATIPAAPIYPEVPPPTVPKDPLAPLKNPQIMMLVAAGIGVLFMVLIGVSGYLLGKSTGGKGTVATAKSTPTINPTKSITPTKGTTPTPTTEPTVGTTQKKTVDNEQLSFSYASDWQVVSEVPKELRYNIMDYISAKTKEDILNSFGKMFAATCRGPILYNEKLKSVIALEVITPVSDGGFCWSGGMFYEPEKRLVSTITPRKEIEVHKWRMNDFLFPINNGETIKVDWKGDWFEQLTVQKSGKKNVIVAGLYSRDATRRTAEKAYDEIVGSLIIK